MNKAYILEALQKGKLNLQGQFVNSSNYTFLINLIYQNNEMGVVYKPVKGETPLWDFPVGTLAKREVAAFLVSEALGWELVPPTVFRKKALLGPGSIQQFIEHDPNYHYFEFKEKDKQRLRPVVVFDFLVNNADRKGGHILLDPQRDRIFLIDHGICFNKEYKLRTVVWDFAGQEIPSNLLDDVRQVLEELRKKGDLYHKLIKYLMSDEIIALVDRAEILLEKRQFPFPDEGRRSYPWPPI